MEGVALNTQKWRPVCSKISIGDIWTWNVLRPKARKWTRMDDLILRQKDRQSKAATVRCMLAGESKPVHVCINLLGLSFHVYPNPDRSYHHSSPRCRSADLNCNIRFCDGAIELARISITESPVLFLVRRACVYSFVELKSWLARTGDRLTERWSCDEKSYDSYERL